jgi:hypothetical protein
MYKKMNILQKSNKIYKEKKEYFFDLAFNTFWNRTGLISPRVVWWNFKHNRNKELQKMLHDGLKSLWFKRQIFQTVFAWQTAGIIKRLDKSIGFDEAHVRFYKDGAVDVELQQSRFWARHWNGKRVFWKKYLKGLIEEMNFSEDTKKSITGMIEDKDFAAFCKRSVDNPRYRVYRYISRKSAWLLGLYAAVSLTFKFF